MADLFLRKKNHTLTPKAIKNLKNNDSTPSLNIEQILINWINTIAEPHCLLLENLFCSDVIETGIIFIEILKNFLNFFGIKDFNPDNRLTKEEKVNLVLTSLMELNKENNFNHFHRQKINYFFNNNKEIFKDKSELISFLELLKSVYDKYGLNNEQIKMKDSSKTQNENLNNINKDNNNNYYKYENKFLQNYKNNNKKDELLEYEIKQKRRKKFENVNQNFSNKINNNNLLNVLLSPQIKENEKKKNISSSLSPTHNIILSISPNNYSKNNSLKSNSNQGSNNKSKVSESLEKKNVSQSTNLNSIPSKKDNLNNINSESNDETEKKLLSKVNITIGLISKNFNVNENFSYYNICRPTKPILHISYNSKVEKFIKFNPLINKKANFNINKLFNNDTEEENFIPKIPNAIKKKIKDWLNSLKLYSKNLTDSSIIYLSHNGVLFCDIINKYSYNNIIKGIIKEPNTDNQKKLNIHKIFNYICNNHKLFNYVKPYINLIKELISQNENIIFGILYGFYKFYNKEFKLFIPTPPQVKYQNFIKRHNQSQENYKEKNSYFQKYNKNLKTIRSWLGKINSTKKNPKENYDDSNFLNAFSINSEFNINNSFDNNYEKHIKRKSFIRINSPSFSQCSSIGLSPSSNTTFEDLKEFTKLNNNYININYQNVSNNKHPIVNSSLINLNINNKCKKSSNQSNDIINSCYNINNEMNPKCFLVFKGSNVSRMRKETKKVIK